MYAVYILADREWGIIDVGYTTHFLCKKSHYTNMEEYAPVIRIKIPNNKTMIDTHTTLIDIPNIPMVGRKCHLFQNMDSK